MFMSVCVCVHECVCVCSCVCYPHVPLCAHLFAGFVWFCSCPVGVRMHVEAVSSKRTRSSSLIEVLTGLLTANTETHSSR